MDTTAARRALVAGYSLVVGRGPQSNKATTDPFGVLAQLSFFVGRPLLVTSRRLIATPATAQA